MHVLRCFSVFFLIKTMQIQNYPWVLKKIRLYVRIFFIVSIWFYCKYQVESRVIEYLNSYKLLIIFRNGWRMLYNMRCQNIIERRILRRCLMRLATPSTVARHVCWGNPRMSSGREFSPPSLFPLSLSRKSSCQLEKKKNLAIFLLS